MPTLMAAAGEPDIKEKLLKGHQAAGKTFKAHLDGYDQTELLSGKGPGKRREIFYFDAGGHLNAVRFKDWKIHFTIMEGAINEAYRKTPSWPLIVNLRMDPYEVVQTLHCTFATSTPTRCGCSYLHRHWLENSWNLSRNFRQQRVTP
jgi:arylsulfatase A-like enzyme